MRSGYGDEPLFYDRDGEPIDDVVQWANLNNDPEYRFLRDETVGSRRVITVWLGLDVATGEYDRPHIFTTGVFNGPGFGANMEAEYSYATEAEALAGHADAVDRLRHLG